MKTDPQTESSILHRLEGTRQIQQLAAAYVVAIDARDLDTMVSLYVDDKVIHGAPPDKAMPDGAGNQGRAALKEWLAVATSYFYRSQHLLGAHTIEFVDETHATGTVQCRAETEQGDRWVVNVFNYRDEYVCVAGTWLFKNRRPQMLYSADLGELPQANGFDRRADKPPTRLPREYPTFAEFWRSLGAETEALVTRFPIDDRSVTENRNGS